jgi:hypothetical protein
MTVRQNNYNGSCRNEIKNKQASIASGIFVALALVAGAMTMIASTAFVNQSLAQTDSPTDGSVTTVALAGQIDSVQTAQGNDTAGWEQSGIWVMRTQIQNNTSPESAEDIEWSHFIASFDMFRPDGSELHSHTIYGFELTSYEVEQESTLSFTGTATVNMPNDVIEQVPVVIQIVNGEDIQITITPEAVDGHFGEQPVNGMLSDMSRDRAGALTGEPAGNGNGATNGNGTGTNGNATDTLRLTTDKQEYEMGETVLFTAENISNDTLTFSDAALGIEITNTDTGQTHSIIAAQVLTTIVGGESAQIEWQPEEDVEPGNFVARIDTIAETPPSSSAETSFTIAEGQE